MTLRNPLLVVLGPLALACVRSALAISGAIVLLLAGTPGALAAEAMDLARLEPRWVVVQVVTTSPGESELRLSEPVLAWYEAGPGQTQRTVSVPGAEVERVLFADRSPVARSFSDFVWVFDASTGHVTSASFSGWVDEPIRIGPLRSSARVAILVELSTELPGGYRAPRQLAGRTVIDYCPDPSGPDCTAVASSVYDTESGWVRANGPVCAVWHSLETVAYTPLGQAQFAELDSSRETRSALHQPRLERRPVRDAGDALAC